MISHRLSMSSILMSGIWFVTVFLLFVLQFQSSGMSFGCGSFLLVIFLRSCNVLVVASALVCVSVCPFLLVKIFRLLVSSSLILFSFPFSRFIGSGCLQLLPICEEKE